MFAAAPVILAAFLASAVEAVEAFTIVLAVSVVRGPRPAVLGAAAAFAVLAVTVAIFGPLIARAPIGGFRLVVGVLLLLFGLGWLRKAVLRAAGVLPLNDESAAFARSTQVLGAPASETAADWIAGMAAFKAVLLEGTEVVFIVLAIASRPGLLVPAALGAALAWLAVLATGLLVRKPLARVPENSLKFAVGALLTGFGVFWIAEGLSLPFPRGDLAIPALVGLYLLCGLILVGWLRMRASRRVAWT